MCYICNISETLEYNFDSSFFKKALSFNNHNLKNSEFTFSFNEKKLISYNKDILSENENGVFLIDYLFFLKKKNKNCIHCFSGYNKKTESILNRYINRFSSNKNISFSEIEFNFLLQNNFFYNNNNFNLLYNKESDFWYELSSNKKILLKNPKIPSKKHFEKYLTSDNFDLQAVIIFLTEYFSKSLNTFGYCEHCHNEKDNFELFLKLSYFNQKLSSSFDLVLFEFEENDLDYIFEFLKQNKKGI